MGPAGLIGVEPERDIMGNTDDQDCRYVIYTDGGCAVNPGGHGACAAVVIDVETGEEKELVHGYLSTTNNRMEMMAVISALESIPDHSRVHLNADSQYVLNTMAGRWHRNKNLDLWERIDRASSGKNIVLSWVRGHDGNPLNERCDSLCTERMETGPFDEDARYVGQTGVSGAGSLIQNDTYGTGHGSESDKSGSKKGAMGVDIQVPDGVEDPDRNRVYRDFVGEAGRRGVEKFLKHKEEVLADGRRLKFKDYASLRVNGRDGLSRLNAEDIAGGLEYGEAARNTVCWYLAGRYADYAMRWYARGLPLEDAIRKVLVDREINDNYLKYGQRNP